MNPTERFSTRVEDYAKYRPGYPEAVFLALSRAGWSAGQTIADVGSGTGILTSLLLSHGNTVIAVEPNEPMRAAAERLLAGTPGFKSVGGTAESTTLPDSFLDGITVAQAFHWFDRAKTKREFRRILKPGGWLALFWNNRVEEATPFSRAYEQLLRELSVDYSAVRERDVPNEAIQEFFQPCAVEKSEFPNSQTFDFEGALGRLMSSSYAPQPGHENHGAMVAAMRRIFNQCEENGRVRFEYRTVVYAGRFKPGD